MLYAKICAIEYHLPEKILDNDELTRDFPEWDVEKIFAKTGIAARHIAAEHETALDLACAAAGKIFTSGQGAPEEIEALIVCTQTPDYILPPDSPLLQERLKLPESVMAFDISHGCSGFVYGLALAKALVESGPMRTVLLVTAETYSKHISQSDRSVRTIFGDGAAATLIRAIEAPQPFIDNFVFHTDGRGAKNLIVPMGGAASAKSDEFAGSPPGGDRTPLNLYMNGPEIFNFSLTVVPQLVRRALAAAALSMADIDAFVFHQANRMMLENLRRRCNIPTEKFPTAFERCGNTVSSTIPIAIKDNLDRGVIEPGGQLLIAGFGVGYSSAAALVRI